MQKLYHLIGFNLVITTTTPHMSPESTKTHRSTYNMQNGILHINLNPLKLLCTNLQAETLMPAYQPPPGTSVIKISKDSQIIPQKKVKIPPEKNILIS